MKKIISLLAAFALILTLPPVLTVSGSAVSYDAEDLKASVSRQVADYAASIAQTGSDSKALFNMGLHACTGGGQSLYLNENNALTATILNSNLFQDALSAGLARTITNMQALGRDSLYGFCSPSWYDHMTRYSSSCYEAADRITYPGFLPYYLSGSSVKAWNGSMNSNDKAMVLIGGGVPCAITVSLVSVQGGTAVYNVDLHIYDDFNFNADYSLAAEKGYDTDNTELMAFLGQYLKNAGLLHDFYWESNVSFQVEVPYDCKETSGSYRWINLGADSGGLISVAGDGFVENAPTQLTYVNTTGQNTYYYRLDDTVSLLHDQPWVIEYTRKSSGSFCLSPLETSGNHLPSIMQRSIYQTGLYTYNRELLTEEEAEALDLESQTYATTNLYAATTRDAFKYSSKYIYTYRLENVVADDGSNMICLSIYNNTKGQLEVANLPLTDHYTRHTGDTDYTLEGEDNWVSGQDILINYIGNKSFRLPDTILTMSIWEYGQEETDDIWANNDSETEDSETEDSETEDSETEDSETEDSETEDSETGDSETGGTETGDSAEGVPEGALPDGGVSGENAPAEPELPADIDTTPRKDATEQIGEMVHEVYDVAKSVASLAGKVFHAFFG